MYTVYKILADRCKIFYHGSDPYLAFGIWDALKRDHFIVEQNLWMHYEPLEK